MTASTTDAPASPPAAGGLRARARHLRGDSILRGASFLILSQGAVAVVGFVFWLAAARLATGEAVGRATSLVSASSLIAYLSVFGINTTFMRFLATSDDADSEVSSGFAVCFVGAVVVSVGYVELLPVIAPRLAFVQHSWLDSTEFVVFTAFGALSILTDSVFLARQATRYIFWSDGVVQGVVKVAMPFVLIGTGVYVTYGAFGIFTSFGAAVAVDVAASIGLIVVRLGYRPQLRIRLRAVTGRLRYTATNYAVTVLDILPTLILPTVVLDGLGGRPAGYFYVAFQVASVLSGVGISISLSAFSAGAQAGALVEEVTRRSRTVLAVAMPPIVVAGLALSPWVLLLFGPAYQHHATATFVVLVLAVPAVALCQWTRSLLQISRQLPSLLVSQSVYAVLVLGLSLLTVHRGLIWVAGSYLVGNLVAAAVAGGAFVLRRHRPAGAGERVPAASAPAARSRAAARHAPAPEGPDRRNDGAPAGTSQSPAGVGTASAGRTDAAGMAVAPAIVSPWPEPAGDAARAAGSTVGRR